MIENGFGHFEVTAAPLSVERENARGRGRESLAPAVGLVAERGFHVARCPVGIALAPVAALDVGHGLFNGFLRDLDARVVGGGGSQYQSGIPA